MPSTLISIRKPRPASERSAMIEAVHAALVESIKIPPQDRTVRLQTFEPGDFAANPKFGENYTIVEVSMFSGRTIVAKRALYQALVKALEPFGVPPAEVKIILHEVPRENWGLRGGIPGSEIELGFKVEV